MADKTDLRRKPLFRWQLDDVNVYIAVSKCTLFRIEIATQVIQSYFVASNASSALPKLNHLPDKTVALL